MQGQQKVCEVDYMDGVLLLFNICMLGSHSWCVCGLFPLFNPPSVFIVLEYSYKTEYAILYANMLLFQKLEDGWKTKLTDVKYKT